MKKMIATAVVLGLMTMGGAVKAQERRSARPAPPPVDALGHHPADPDGEVCFFALRVTALVLAPNQLGTTVRAADLRYEVVIFTPSPTKLYTGLDEARAAVKDGVWAGITTYIPADKIQEVTAESDHCEPLVGSDSR